MAWAPKEVTSESVSEWTPPEVREWSPPEVALSQPTFEQSQFVAPPDQSKTSSLDPNAEFSQYAGMPSDERAAGWQRLTIQHPELGPIEPTGKEIAADYAKLSVTPIIRFGDMLGLDPKTVADAWDVVKAVGTSPMGRGLQEELAKPSRPPTVLESTIAGSQRAVVDSLDFFTSPVGAMTLGTASAPVGVQRAVGLAFAVQMSQQAPEQFQQFLEAKYAGDTEGMARSLTGLGLTGAFVTAGTAHGVKGVPGEIAGRVKDAAIAALPETPQRFLEPGEELNLDELKQVAPLTAKAVEEIPATNPPSSASAQQGGIPPVDTTETRAVPSAEEVVAKQPWEMTRQDYAKSAETNQLELMSPSEIPNLPTDITARLQRLQDIVLAAARLKRPVNYRLAKEAKLINDEGWYDPALEHYAKEGDNFVFKSPQAKPITSDKPSAEVVESPIPTFEQWKDTLTFSPPSHKGHVLSELESHLINRANEDSIKERPEATSGVQPTHEQSSTLDKWWPWLRTQKGYEWFKSIPDIKRSADLEASSATKMVPSQTVEGTEQIRANESQSEPTGRLSSEDKNITPTPPPLEPAPTGETKVKQPWEMTGQDLKDLADKLLSERKAGGSVAAPFDSWQVTRKAYVDYAKLENRKPIVSGRLHEEKVRRAVGRGDPVPAEVLKDYPDLQQPPPAPASEGGMSVGPGAASPGDVPSEPPIASTPEHNRPAGIVSANAPKNLTVSSVLLGAKEAIGTMAKEFQLGLRSLAGRTLPRITDAKSEAGEAGARYGASRIAARPLASTFTTSVLEGTGVDPVKFGAALTEDNLRSVREGFRADATRLTAEGKPDEAAKATAAGDDVVTLVGGKNSPFKTEEAYQDFLNQPDTKRAIEKHLQHWQETIDPQYRMARDIDPDVELPTRGQQTGARVNLKALQEGDEAVKAAEGMATAPRLTGTFKRKTPFGLKASGTGQKYETDYSEIIANTFEKQLEIANKNAFDNSLVKNGLAEIHRPGWRGTIGGRNVVAFPLRRGVRPIRTSEGEVLPINVSANIYVRGDLANEYRTVSNVDARLKIPLVTTAMNFLNRVQLAGLTDFTVHTSNLITALFNNPTAGKLLGDSLLSATGRADVPVTFTKAVIKSFQKNEKQLSELAEIGALRSTMPHGNIPGRFLQRIDRITRLVLDDTYQSLADAGLVEKSQTARREFVNQVGQYNKRLQPRLAALLRDTGISPFITAGRTFNALGVRMATLTPAIKGSSGMAAAQLRLNLLAKWGGFAILLGGLNYLLTANKGGGVMGRPGTPIGRLDTGLDDKNGRPLGLPLMDLIGLGRGLRVTGLKGFIDAERYGLPLQTALDSAARDILNSQIGPIAGPAVHFGFTAASGQAPAVSVGRTSPVAPPQQSQSRVNVQTALRDANPVIASIFDKLEGKPTSEALGRQLTRFTLQPGKQPEMIARYPEIVRKAQANEYVNYVIHEARQKPMSERRQFVTKQFERLEQSERENANTQVERRGVYKYK